MDVALTAVRLGAKNVTLVCLEQEEEMPAAKEEVARAKEEGVKIVNGRGLSKIIVSKEKAAGLETVKCVSVFDDKHLSLIHIYSHTSVPGNRKSQYH